MRNILRSCALIATALAVAAPLAGAQDKPVTPKQVAKNVQAEAHRAGARTRDAAHKAGKQTEAQAQRTGKAAERAVSRTERREARGDTLQPPAATAHPSSTDKPVTPKQVGKNVQSETHRVGNRTRDAAHKAGNQTEAQAHRTGKALKKVVSRKARHDSTE
jgi:hypothetical protein